MAQQRSLLNEKALHGSRFCNLIEFLFCKKTSCYFVVDKFQKELKVRQILDDIILNTCRISSPWSFCMFVMPHSLVTPTRLFFCPFAKEIWSFAHLQKKFGAISDWAFTSYLEEGMENPRTSRVHGTGWLIWYERSYRMFWQTK